jgi:hypothetical protein
LLVDGSTNNDFQTLLTCCHKAARTWRLVSTVGLVPYGYLTTTVGLDGDSTSVNDAFAAGQLADGDNDGLPDICEKEAQFWLGLGAASGCANCVSSQGIVVRKPGGQFGEGSCQDVNIVGPPGPTSDALYMWNRNSCPENNKFAFYDATSDLPFWLSHDVARQVDPAAIDLNYVDHFNPDGFADCDQTELRMDMCQYSFNEHTVCGNTTDTDGQCADVSSGSAKICVWAEGGVAAAAFKCSDGSDGCPTCAIMYRGEHLLPGGADNCATSPCDPAHFCVPFGQQGDNATGAPSSGMSTGTVTAVAVGSSFAALLLLLIVVLFFIRRGDKKPKSRSDRGLLADHSVEEN